MTDPSIEEYLPESGTGTAVMYLRTTAPTTGYTTQRDCLEQLSRLEASGQLSGTTVQVWGDSICTAAPEVTGLDDILETITDLYKFSGQHEATIAPFFNVERVTATIPGETFERIVPPCRTLVFTDGDRICGVFPCRINEQTLTPIDAINYLEGTANIDKVDTPEITTRFHR
jgi:hypothetical protein